MANKGIIFYKGDAGSPSSNIAKSMVRNVIDEAALITLRGVLMAYSDCNDAGHSFASQSIIDAVAPASDVDTDFRGIIYMKDTATGNIMTITIPGLTSTAWELQGEGKRVTNAVVTAVVDAVATATGKSLQALYGKVISKG